MYTTEEQFTVTSNAKCRLDKYLCDTFPAYSRSYFQRLISQKSVLLNNKVAKKRFLVEIGDLLHISFSSPKTLEIKPYSMNLDILFEDEDFIAINKPSGLVVHPAPGHYDKTLVNALIHHLGTFKDFSDTERPGIIHRLDKDTSGVILCAKTLYGHAAMTEAFSKREVDKSYLALCQNRPTQNCIEAPIKRHQTRRKEMAINPTGKAAKTEIELLGYNDRFSLVIAKPITGRTHQIRVHLKSIKCPIVSDPIYGQIHPDYPRLMLHAYTLQFTHPKSKKRIHLKAPLDETFELLYKSFVK